VLQLPGDPVGTVGEGEGEPAGLAGLAGAHTAGLGQRRDDRESPAAFGVRPGRLALAVSGCGVGAGIACMLKDEPDGAGEWATPVLDLPPGLRIATVTGWLADLDHHLAANRYARVPTVAELRQEIRDFTTTAPGTEEETGEEDST
jgi:hypothetical protein